MSAKSIGLDDELHSYLVEHGVRDTRIKRALRERTDEHEWSKMRISPEQGEFMALLVKLSEASRCIEVGTFTGYSALCVALALPEDGELICCDVNEEWTAIGVEYWKRAGVSDKIDLRIAPALETLAELIETRPGQFDLIFLDADKANYPRYYEMSLELLRAGGVVLIDNVLWSGDVLDEDTTDPETIGIREVNAIARDDERVDLSMLPVGDGLTLARKRSE